MATLCDSVPWLTFFAKSVGSRAPLSARVCSEVQTNAQPSVELGYSLAPFAARISPESADNHLEAGRGRGS